MSNIYLITENYIKANSPVTLNSQMKDLHSHIIGAQELYLRVILGDGYLLHLQTEYDAQTLSPDELTLMDKYIQPALLWRMLYLAAPFVFVEWRAKGFVTNNDDNGQSAAFDEVKYIRHELGNRAEVLEEQLRKYLCTNNSKFPKFVNQDGLNQPNTSTNFNSGLIFY